MNKKETKYAHMVYTILSLALIIILNSCIEKGSEIREDRQGLILNIAADAIVKYPDWDGEIVKKGAEFIATGYNPDPDHLQYYISSQQAVTALRNYVDLYANTQVTSLFFNINYQRACFDNKVMEPYWDVKEPEKSTSGWARLHWILHEKGIDPYEICIDQSRLKNISPWISIRMNDHHYFDDSTKINKFMLDHPEYRKGPNGLFNYAIKEVRDFYKAFIIEILDKYDVDGIELDWMRTHSIFNEGEVAEGTELINLFMKEIRELTNLKSQQLNHPVRIASRVPSSPEIGKSFGLDGVNWVQNNYVDILIPTNWHYPVNFDIPVEQWRNEIGEGYEYILAPGADAGRKSFRNQYHKTMLSNIESMLGFSASAYNRGADAIYYFNNFDPVSRRKIVNPDGTVSITDDKQRILKEAGKLSTVMNKPRCHLFSYKDPDIKSASTASSKLPQGVKNEYSIHSGPKPEEGNYIIRIGLESLIGYEDAILEVTLNEKPCQQIEDMPRDPAYKYDNTKKWEVVTNVSETGARMMQFSADLNEVKEGYNRIGITNNQKEEQEITWLEVYIN